MSNFYPEFSESSSFLDKSKEKYSTLLKSHQKSYKSLGWGSAKSQHTRFAKLTKMIDREKPTILDVGCGLCDLWDYLVSKNIQCDYTGVDITQEMIKESNRLKPHVNCFECNILNDSLEKKYDYVLASGIFTYVHDKETMHSLIKKMFELSINGIAFNSLSTLAPHRERDEFYACPKETFEFCTRLSSSIILDHSYFEHDFTLFVHKEPVLN